jgi:hypothetical protein
LIRMFEYNLMNKRENNKKHTIISVDKAVLAGLLITLVIISLMLIYEIIYT